jgi:hemerythrin
MPSISRSPLTASQFDDEHRALLLLTGRLRAALAGSPPAGRAEPLCRELSAKTRAHFSHEQRLMQAVRYPHFDWHRSQHAAARARLTRLNRCVLRGSGDPRAELDLLARWLNEHIQLSDRMLMAYVRNFERARLRDILD